jgi:hypothetical protein
MIGKIQTRHPTRGKRGRSIDRQKYEALKAALLAVLEGAELTHTELMDVLATGLRGGFEGNVSWYAETVKLDLEARKLIERTDSKPQKYRLRAPPSQVNQRLGSWPEPGEGLALRTPSAAPPPAPGGRIRAGPRGSARTDRAGRGHPRR